MSICIINIVNSLNVNQSMVLGNLVDLTKCYFLSTISLQNIYFKILSITHRSLNDHKTGGFLDCQSKQGFITNF